MSPLGLGLFAAGGTQLVAAQNVPSLVAVLMGAGALMATASRALALRFDWRLPAWRPE